MSRPACAHAQAHPQARKRVYRHTYTATATARWGLWSRRPGCSASPAAAPALPGALVVHGARSTPLPRRTTHHAHRTSHASAPAHGCTAQTVVRQARAVAPLPVPQRRASTSFTPFAQWREQEQGWRSLLLECKGAVRRRLPRRPDAGRRAVRRASSRARTIRTRWLTGGDVSRELCPRAGQQAEQAV